MLILARLTVVMDVRYVVKDVRGFCSGDFEIEFIHGRLFFLQFIITVTMVLSWISIEFVSRSSFTTVRD
jgi:hypothetical protein